MIQKILSCLVVFLVAIACDDPKTGPEKIAWDRDTSDLCRMVISDPRFVAQVRGGEDRKVRKFDDIGDALIWLKDYAAADHPRTEIWVADYRLSTRERIMWLDARKAHYVSGQRTPMDHGFGAISAPEPGAISFPDMHAAVLDRALSFRARVPQLPAGGALRP